MYVNYCSHTNCRITYTTSICIYPPKKGFLSLAIFAKTMNTKIHYNHIES